MVSVRASAGGGERASQVSLCVRKHTGQDEQQAQLPEGYEEGAGDLKAAYFGIKAAEGVGTLIRRASGRSTDRGSLEKGTGRRRST